MSSIHYKFRATLEYKTLQFDGLHITGADLKKEICLKEGIKAEAFDLLLQNAHTKRSYTAEELIPRNSSIIVQRVPREDAEKLPKIQGVNTGIVVRNSTVETGLVAPAHMNQEEFEKLSEEDQIAHIKDVSTAKYHSSNFQKKTTNIMSGPPPPTYTCNRCYQPGHWYKNCPMLATKRTTGIPSQELMETTAEDPLAMLHPSGKLVVPIMHWKARQHTKKVAEEGPTIERVPPPELTCPLCSHLLKDAVLTTCCGHSFCADCISSKLIDSPDRQCPGKNCDQKELSVDALVPNKTVRQAVQAWATGGPGSGNQDSEQVRFRIGLQSTAPVSSSSTPPPQQPYPPGVPHSTATSLTTATQPATDGVQGQNSPNPFAAAPPVAVPVPTSFSQPPPNIVSGVVASSSSSGDSLLPPVSTAVPPPTLSLPITQIAMTGGLPPIPGVGLPLQTHMIVPAGTAQQSYIFNQPPPVTSMTMVAPQPQIMDAWDAFLHRKDRERERPRKRLRSRNRSTSSTSSSSDDGRRKRRDRHERERRRVHRGDKERDRDRTRDNRFRRGEERRERDREGRDREREWTERDRHRDNRPVRVGTYSSRGREAKEEAPLPSLMGLDVATPPNLGFGGDKRQRSRSRSVSPHIAQTASTSERRKSKKKKTERVKGEPHSSRTRKSEKEQKVKKTNENEDVAREIADEEAIDGTLREVAEFVRVEANCDDDGIEFEVEDAADVGKETVTEAEDEKSVTDTEPQHEEPTETTAEAISEAENEEPVERRSESDATQITKEDTTDKEKDTAAEPVDDDEDRSSPRKKEKKHKKHKKHKRSRDDDVDGDSESKHKHHKRKKEKKEKKDKKKEKKKHKREKEEDTSDGRVKEEEQVTKKEKTPENLETTDVQKNLEAEDVQKKVDYKEDRRGSDSSEARKRKQHHKESHSDRKREEKEKERKPKAEDSRRPEEKRVEKEKDRSEEKKHQEKSHSHSKHEKSRDRSRERDERRSKHHSKEHSSKRKENESDREKEPERPPREREHSRKEETKPKDASKWDDPKEMSRREDPKEMSRREDPKAKERHERDHRSERAQEKPQRRESAPTGIRRDRPPSESSDPKATQRSATKEPQVAAAPLAKEAEESTSAIRKQKIPIKAPNEEEPITKKLKAEAVVAKGPVKAALTSMVKFKVNPVPVKKVGPILKQFAVSDKESTDVEEDKSKVSTDDDGGGDRRMREAFSPPKLQRKKITLNL